MLTELQTKKWTRMFQVYDANGNGVIEKDDFEQIFQNIAAARNLTPGTPEYEQKHSEFMADWEPLQKAVDKNNDGKIELTEWLEYGANRMDNPDISQTIANNATQIFELLDMNGNGVISLEEYKTFYRSWRLPEELALEIFPKLDLNGDGQISKEEFVELIQQFHSDDPELPGNFLLGPY